MVEGVQQAIKGMQALVSVEGLEREVKVGRQNRGFGNECCSRENYSFLLCYDKLNRDGAIRMTTCEVPWNCGAWHQHSNKLFKTRSAKETYMLRTMRHLRANKPLEWERRPARKGLVITEKEKKGRPKRASTSRPGYDKPKYLFSESLAAKQRGQSNSFSPMAIDNEKTEWGPVPMSEDSLLTPLVVRRKTARRNLNKQRAALWSKGPSAIKRKLAQTPKQPKITQFKKSTKNLL